LGAFAAVRRAEVAAQGLDPVYKKNCDEDEDDQGSKKKRYDDQQLRDAHS